MEADRAWDPTGSWPETCPHPTDKDSATGLGMVPAPLQTLAGHGRGKGGSGDGRGREGTGGQLQPEAGVRPGCHPAYPQVQAQDGRAPVCRSLLGSEELELTLGPGSAPTGTRLGEELSSSTFRARQVTPDLRKALETSPGLSSAECR